jgi:hypothetical protein
MAKKTKEKKARPPFLIMLNGVLCVCLLFFFKKKKQMDENIITLTISELTREFCFSLFFEKKEEDASFLFGIFFLLHVIAELIKEAGYPFYTYHYVDSINSRCFYFFLSSYFSIRKRNI